MKRHTKFLLLLVCFLLITGSVVADAPAKKEGYKLYRQHCGQCHGRQQRFLQDITRLQFSNALTNGKGTMPPMGRGLSEQEKLLIWVYIQQ